MAAKEGFRKYTNPLRHRKTPHEMVRDPLATDCEVNRTHIFQIVREKVAIVFVPGIMGSRLVSQKKDRVWDPDAKPCGGCIPMSDQKIVSRSSYHNP
jgi:hypothetical protein